MNGRVVLVGAGPGDPDLLTVRALRELERAEVLLYDALIPPVLLELAAPECERIDVGKRGDGTRGVAQDDIAKLMLEKARAGRYVVRLKGGDPFVFGRGGEELSALVDADVPFEVVPGVTSPFAALAYAGIPVTDRRLSSSVAIVSGHRGKNTEDQRNDWERLARSADTLVILMGTAWLEDIVERVIGGGRDPETPSALISNGTTARQRVVTAKLRDLPARVREAGLGPPSVILIGDVARLRDSLAWFEKRPLFGRRVLVPRAEEQRTELLLRLSRAGAEPVSVPLMRFEPTRRPEELRSALEGASAYDWLIFTSANAVRFSAPHLEGLTSADARSGRPRIACIGPATARAAKAAGLQVELTPAESSVPEELARSLGERSRLAGARILLPRAAEPRDELRQTLAAAGAKVHCVEAYLNGLPPDAGPELRSALEAGLDAVLVTSPSTVERLACLLGESVLSALAKSAQIVCIGPSSAGALRDHGLEPDAVAARQSADGLVEALERCYSEGDHGIS